jgi:hypothetical protein
LIALCALGAQASTLPPDPNNAALLYYQAFLLRPEPDYAAEQLVYKTPIEQFNEILRGGKLEFDTDTEEQIRKFEKKLKNHDTEPNETVSELERMMGLEVNSEGFIYDRLHTLRERLEHERKMRGVVPNETIRAYMRSCREAIEIAQAASEISECDWGFRYSRGFTLGVPQLIEIKNLGTVLRTDALLLAADGDYRAAFERCLMIRRFARHVGDDGIFAYTTSTTLGSSATYCIRILLGQMRPDVDTLTWLKGELTAEAGSSPSFTRALKTEMELALQRLRTNREGLLKARDELAGKAPDENAKKEIYTLADEKFIALVQKPYADFLSSILRVMDQKAPYTEKVAEMQRLTENLEKQFDSYLFTKMFMYWPKGVRALYTHHVLHEAHFNAFMAGIEIHLVRAKTGQLPEELPEGLPKDPFSGKDFEYEITDDGFVLRCRARDLEASPTEVRPGHPPKVLSDKFQQYEFKVKR